MEGPHNGQEWTLLYEPDDINEIYYVSKQCACGRKEIRVMVNYPLYNSPGVALADFGLHLVGSTFTRTPELNVLWAKQYITG